MSLSVHTQARPKTLTEVIKWEGPAVLSRSTEVMLAGDSAVRQITVGAVLGKALFAAPVIAAGGGNTGNGSIASATLGAAAKLGVYRVTCIAEASDAGAFEVTDPDGFALGRATVGVAYANAHVAFTIADGAEDYDLGDTFTITVGAGTGKVTAIDFAATDGRQIAHGVAATDAIAPDGVDSSIVAVVRQAVVGSQAIGWPTGASADQKAAAIAQLAARDILVETLV